MILHIRKLNWSSISRGDRFFQISSRSMYSLKGTAYSYLQSFTILLQNVDCNQSHSEILPVSKIDFSQISNTYLGNSVLSVRKFWTTKSPLWNILSVCTHPSFHILWFTIQLLLQEPPDDVRGGRPHGDPGGLGDARAALEAAALPGTNCIKIGLPEKSILGDYFQENMTSRRPFLLLRISFPGRPIFIQLPLGMNCIKIGLPGKLILGDFFQ